MYSSNFKNRSIEPFTRVKVYRNLLNGLFSLQVFQSKHPLNNKVACHFSSVTISVKENPIKISQSGQLRARRQKTRNVHAYLIGRIHGVSKKVDLSKGIKLSYIPFVDDTFVKANSDREEWTPNDCKFLHFEDGKAYAFMDENIFI
ncbi:hypothetical protein [Vibrio sp. R78045]|uniref:hypothetical protein n=1 Tax=Vibrio sp. R78045 TaxID=3093868 RepID=UPI0036F3DB96